MPDGLPVHMSYLVGEPYKAVVNNIDSLGDFARAGVSSSALRVGEIIEEDINDLKALLLMNSGRLAGNLRTR
jgi:hypothetical protein